MKSYERVKTAVAMQEPDVVPVVHSLASPDMISPAMHQDWVQKYERHAKEEIGDRVCLIGNLEPSAVLLQGSVSLVEEHSRQVIEGAGQAGGLILGSGCEVAPAAPQENIKAMIRVARDHHYS